MGYKYYKTRVRSLTADLNPGDHIRRFRGLYYHHMLVVEVISCNVLLVIHYTGSELEGLARSCCVSSSGQTKARIIEETICFDLRQDVIELLEYVECDVPINVGYEAVKCARERLGEEEYHLLHNNCESFVNWAITHKSVSNQAEAGVTAVGTAATAVGIGVGIGLLAYGIGQLLSGSSDEPKRKK